MLRHRWRGPMAIAVLGLGAVLAACSASSDPRTPITTYHDNVLRSGFSSDSTLSDGQASSLTQKWAISVSKPISAQAVVADSTVYWGDWNGMEHASTTSGKQLWSTFVGLAPKPPGCPFDLGDLGVTSTATVGDTHGRTMVWVGGGGGNLYGLDASSGAVAWRTNLGTPPENTLWSSPAFFDGSIYEGVASWNDCPGVVYGKLFRIDAANGKVQRVFSPEQGRCVGGGIWSSPTVDVDNNAVFVTTGNDDCDSPVQNSIFKLNASSLAVEAQWQSRGIPTVSDADFGATPTLFTATVGGHNRLFVAGEAKDGIYYAFDRNALGRGPVWTHVVEDDSTLSSSACEDINTISSSSWAGPGHPLMVAGLAVQGSSCIGTLAALNPADGMPEWQADLQGPVLGAVSQAPGLVAVGAGSYLDVLTSGSGARLFTYPEPQTGHPQQDGYNDPHWFWAPPTFAGNSLYIGNRDGTLRAFSP